MFKSSGSSAPAPTPIKPADKPAAGGKAESVHGFDPTSLERAAKAAKELDQSKNARNAMDVIRSQEATKQKEAESERAKYLAMKEELAIRRVQEEEAAARRAQESQTQQDKLRADYKDELERKRLRDQINAQRHLQEEERKKQEESLRRQEEIRRKTLEYEAELRQSTEMARVKAETEGKILQERKNHDLTLENKRVEASEFRKTVVEAATLTLKSLGDGFNDFISDKQKLQNTVLSFTALAVGIYTAKVSTQVAGKFIEARMGKPSLVRETSKKNVLQMASSPFSTFKLMFGKKDGLSALDNIVIEPGLADRLKRVAVSTAHTRTNKAPFRHLLLHGPPGTGKTMFAKGLAKQSGLHYAIMTGGDIAPLGKDAVTEIHKIFDWANTSTKGVLLFVDEADAFLRKRSTEKISEDMRNALNAFLYRTGETSKKFMIVYASNQPEQFDWAINDRIDEMIEFKLPNYNERLKMIAQYMDQYLLKPTEGAKQIAVENVDEDFIKLLAQQTLGYSGREISKLVIAFQAAGYGSASAKVDKELLMKVLHENKETKDMKKSWLSVAEKDNAGRVVDN